MSAETIATVVKIMEALPDAAQEWVVEYLRDYLAEIQDKIRKDDRQQRLDNLRQARGLWANRDDLPEFDALRKEWDRHSEVV